MFSLAKEFSLLESCQLYIITKCKAITCCKIEALIQMCSVEKMFLKILQNHWKTPVPGSLNQIAA